MKKLPAKRVMKALAVEVIRLLWDRGLYRDNKWLRLCHDNWLHHWLDWRTFLTMEAVDSQAKKMTPEPEVVKPLYWEEEEGETPLGGAFGYTYDFVDDAPGGADPLQGPE